MQVASTAPQALLRESTQKIADESERRQRAAARDFEKMFVAEMLRLTELSGAIGGSFSGGFGEEAFRSFMIDAYSEKIVETGQFGISETVFQALAQREEL